MTHFGASSGGLGVPTSKSLKGPVVDRELRAGLRLCELRLLLRAQVLPARAEGVSPPLQQSAVVGAIRISPCKGNASLDPTLSTCPNIRVLPECASHCGR